MRVRIAREELRRLRELPLAINRLEREITALVQQIAPQLLTEPGFGPLIAAKLLGEIAGAQRFATPAKLADKLGCTLTERTDAPPRSHPADRHVVTPPIVDLPSYYCALHEARAWAWALDHALTDPDKPTELANLEAWTTHIEARDGNVTASGVELVAAEHQGEYAAAWPRCRRTWWWDADRDDEL